MSQPVDYKLTSLPIKLGTKFQNIYNQYKHLCHGAVGIHARLGNGELTYMRKSNRPRLYINHNKFIDEMRRHHSLFFVCTDTKKFIDKVTSIFKNNVISIPRIYAPEGNGPGHRASQYHEKDMYNHIGHAVTEMLLLGHCDQLIYNVSNFTFYARFFKKVKSLLIT